MARHYKQSRKDRHDESRGMKKYERKHHKEDSDRRHPLRHASHEMMLPPDAAEQSNGHETQLYHKGKGYYGPGYGHIANMPPYADLGLYPKGRKYLKTDNYPDTIEEIDTDNDFNYGQVERHRSDSMY